MSKARKSRGATTKLSKSDTRHRYTKLESQNRHGEHSSANT